MASAAPDHIKCDLAIVGGGLAGGLIALAVCFALMTDLFLLPGLIRWSSK